MLKQSWFLNCCFSGTLWRTAASTSSSPSGECDLFGICAFSNRGVVGCRGAGSWLAGTRCHLSASCAQQGRHPFEAFNGFTAEWTASHVSNGPCCRDQARPNSELLVAPIADPTATKGGPARRQMCACAIGTSPVLGPAQQPCLLASTGQPCACWPSAALPPAWVAHMPLSAPPMLRRQTCPGPVSSVSCAPARSAAAAPRGCEARAR